MQKKIYVFLFMAVSLLCNQVLSQEKPSLEQQIADLQQQLNALKQQHEAEKEAAANKAKNAPVIVISSKEGATLKAADDSYKLKLSGYAQADARLFKDDNVALGTTDTFLLRTVRVTFSGSFSDFVDFNISPEFAGSSVSLPDASVDLKFYPALKFRAGKFKTPFALERLQASTAITFAELGLPGNLGPNRDIGFQLFGDLFKETVSYNVGIFNGLQDGATSVTDSNKDKDLVARVFMHPFKNSDTLLGLRGLGFGLAATHGKRKDTNANLAKYKTAGQANFFSYLSTVTTSGVTTLDVVADGTQTRFSPQMYYYYKSFGFLGEYITSEAELVRTTTTTSNRGKFRNKAWQAAASYILSGDEASYKGVTPLHPFSLKNGKWWALELAARYAVLDIDDDIFKSSFANISRSATKAEALTLGLNWYLTRNVKYTLDYERTSFDGGAAGGTDRPTEDLFISRVQLQY